MQTDRGRKTGRQIDGHRETQRDRGRQTDGQRQRERGTHTDQHTDVDRQ